MRLASSTSRSAGAVWPATFCSPLVTFVVVFPIYTTVIASLKPGDEVLVNPLVPDRLHARRAVARHGRRADLGRYLFNSLVVGGDRHRRPGRHVGARRVRVRDPRVPGQARAVPRCSSPRCSCRSKRRLVVNFETVDGLGWTNTFIGLSVPFLATAFGIFLLRQVFMTLPARPPRRGVDRRGGPLRIPPPRGPPARAADARSAGLVQLPRRRGTSTCGRISW